MESSLKKLKEKIDLSFNETKDIFSKIMSGNPQKPKCMTS